MSNQKTTMQEHIAQALNELAYAPHEAEWARNKWPEFLPHADAVLIVMANRAWWPMDRISEELEKAGIDHPRPSEVLRAFFDSCAKTSDC